MLRRRLNYFHRTIESQSESVSAKLEDGAEKVKTWSKFCDETSLPGVRYICGTKPLSFNWRLVWGIIYLSTLSTCIWLCINTVNTYTEGNVATASTFSYSKELEFPSITICNQNMFKKSMVGNSWQLMKMMATFSSLSDREEDIEELAMKNWKYCNNSNISVLDDKALWEKGYVQGMREVASDSFSSVQKLNWVGLGGFYVNDSKVSANFFLNHIVDHHGICFTINPGTRYMTSVTKNNTVIPNFGYGLEGFAGHQSWKITDPGLSNGLSVTLNTGQEEYCGLQNKYGGVGFKAIIHHPEDPPWFLMQTPLLLEPSTEHIVVLSMTKFQRRTSRMGRCVDDLYLHLTPDAPRYFKNQCYQQCFVEQVFRKCRCFPQFYYRNQDRRGPVYIDGERVNVTNYCWKETMVCMNRAKKNYLDNNPRKACPHCKEACDETRYNYVASSFIFPTEHSVAFLSKHYSVDEEILQKQFLQVHFFFKSMQINYETESPRFTWLDLCTYLGGVIGLCLGASIMSFGEVFQQMLISGKRYLRKNCRMKKIVH